jgi:hypothetical protein
MLLLTSQTITVEGLTVYPDHADPDQFWYLPGPVQLGKNAAGKSAFTFIQYRPAAVAGGAKGGGFLTFAVDLRLSRELERRILSRLRSIAKGKPRLAAVPFDEGTVQVVALDLQGSGGTASTAAAGTFRAVEKILGATTPSLAGDNTAAFSLTLSQEGAVILRRSYEQGAEPVGVIYDLKYTGMRPALKVKITADYKRIYSQFSASLDAQVYFVRAGIEAAFEKLKQDGAIKIEITDLTGADDQEEKIRWALDFFKDSLLRQWFEPTLTPGQVAGGMPQAEGLDAVLKRGNELRPPTTPAPPKPVAAAVAAVGAQLPKRATAPTEGTGKALDHEGLHAAAPRSDAPKGANPLEGTGFPAEAPAPPAAAAAGAPKAANPAGAALQSAGSASPAVVSLKLRHVKQEELKTLSFTYDRAEATQRTYAPQGFFGLLVQDLDKANHFVEVDLDDPFFRTFEVSVEPPEDFDRIGLQSAHVSIAYGDPADAGAHKQADFVFDKDNRVPQKFQTFLSKKFDTSFVHQVQFHFSAQSEWQSKQFSYDIPAVRGEDRTLLLNPHAHLAFLDLHVEPVRVDWGIVDSMEVLLQHGQGPDLIERQLLFTSAKPEAQSWKVRSQSREDREFRYSVRTRLKNGEIKETEQKTSRGTLLPIEDPFPASLELELIPLLDANQWRQAFVDIEYHDQPNDYHRELQIKVDSKSSDPVRVSLAALDPQQRQFRYRLTLVGKNNSLVRGQFIETEDTLIPVAAPDPN